MNNRHIGVTHNVGDRSKMVGDFSVILNLVGDRRRNVPSNVRARGGARRREEPRTKSFMPRTKTYL